MFQEIKTNWLAAKSNWQNITFQWRVVYIYASILFLMGAGIVLRLDTVVNHNLERVTGYSPEIIAFGFWFMIPVLLLTYAVMKNIYAVLIGMSPYFAYTFILASQVFNSQTAPLTHAVTSIIVAILIFAMFWFAEELDEIKHRYISQHQSDGG